MTDARLAFVAVADLDAVYRPMFASVLAPGEALDGVLAASQRQSAFKGRGLAIRGDTDEAPLPAVDPTGRR